MTDRAGTYDRAAAGRALTASRAAQLAADPFAGIPGAGFSETASVLETHPGIAFPVSLDLDRAWTGRWTPSVHATDAELTDAASIC